MESGETARLYKRLAALMPLKKRDAPGGRGQLSYVDVEQVISRLNSVLGVDGWGFAITERWHEQDSDCCCVRGLLTVHWPNGRDTIHEDVGGQVVNRRKADPNKPGVIPSATEIANDWKGAQSDCLKRCATQIGVGLFLRTKSQQLSEVPRDDQPERDRSPLVTAAPKPAAANPAGVAQGQGTGGVQSFSERRDATPPAQPEGSIEWLWGQWKATAGVASAMGVKFVEPPRDMEAAPLGRYLKKLELRIAEAKGAAVAS